MRQRFVSFRSISGFRSISVTLQRRFCVDNTVSDGAATQPPQPRDTSRILFEMNAKHDALPSQVDSIQPESERRESELSSRIDVTLTQQQAPQYALATELRNFMCYWYKYSKLTTTSTGMTIRDATLSLARGGCGDGWRALGYCLGEAERVTVNGRSLNAIDCYVEALTHDRSNVDAWQGLRRRMCTGECVTVNGCTMSAEECRTFAVRLVHCYFANPLIS